MMSLIRSVAVWSWLVMLCLLATHAYAATANDAAIRQACTDLVMGYAYHRDREDADALADLFTEQAVMKVLGQTLEGRSAIHARIAAASGDTRYRHLMSTVYITVLDARNARGVSYVTVVAGPEGDGVVGVDSYTAIGEYHDRFVLTDAGWKIAHRELQLAFRPTAGD